MESGYDVFEFARKQTDKFQERWRREVDYKWDSLEDDILDLVKFVYNEAYKIGRHDGQNMPIIESNAPTRGDGEWM